MSKLAQRTPIPAVIGQLILSAYVFSDESDAHGVVLTFEDGSDLSIEFDREARVSWKVLQSNENDGKLSPFRYRNKPGGGSFPPPLAPNGS